MAEQLPTDWTIHPGWYIAASVVCGVWAYLMIGAWTYRTMERLSFIPDGPMFGFWFWPIVLPILVGYYWAKSCEPKPETPPEKTP